jgi:hypothetical protein
VPYKAPWARTGRAVTRASLPLAPAPPPAEAADFVGLSVELTGFDEAELLGTGSTDIYYGYLAGTFPDVLAELLAAWRRIAILPPDEREAAVRREILADPKLGPFARAVLVLWYTATWNALPAEWSQAYGYHGDANQTFGPAYPEGLVWKAAHLHPGGAKPTGFGTWAFEPEQQP